MIVKVFIMTCSPSKQVLLCIVGSATARHPSKSGVVGYHHRQHRLLRFICNTVVVPLALLVITTAPSHCVSRGLILFMFLDHGCIVRAVLYIREFFFEGIY